MGIKLYVVKLTELMKYMLTQRNVFKSTMSHGILLIVGLPYGLPFFSVH